MKNILGIILFSVGLVSSLAQDISTRANANGKSFPTNIDKNNFEKLEIFNGKIVAFDGVIEKNETSKNNTPFYKLKIDDSNYLWTVLMFKNDNNEIGDTIRVVGYLVPTPKHSEIDVNERKFLEGKYMVISFGIVDFQNSNFLFIGGADKQKQEWIDGKIPTSK